MGRSYLFDCPRCGYKAKVSGGPDRGLHFSVQTIFCRDCKKLFDAVVRLKVPPAGSALFRRRLNNNWRLHRAGQPAGSPPTFESALNRLLIPEAKRVRWLQFKVRCPVSPSHRVHFWKYPGKCPKCGTYLEKNALPFRIWD